MRLSEVAVRQVTGGTQRNRQTPATSTATSKPRTGLDIVRALREERARKQTAAETSVKTEATAAKYEEAVEKAAGYLVADELLTLKLA